MDDIAISISGMDFLARAGTTDAKIYTDIVKVSAEELILRIQTPPAVRDAVITGETCIDMSVCVYALDVNM